MTCVTIEPKTPRFAGAGRRPAVGVLAVAALASVLAACGGGDDESTEAATTTTVVSVAPTTTVAPVTTTIATTTTTTVAFVTDGATLVVANASGINGAAGRLTDRLAIAGFSTTTATNSAASVSNITTTQVYYDPAADGAQAVAESVRAALGGGDIEVLELEIPAPTESGDLGDAQVLVLMGNDVADKSLDELQGTAPAADATGDDATGETADDAATGDG